jgi:hypothetical protein
MQDKKRHNALMIERRQGVKLVSEGVLIRSVREALYSNLAASAAIAVNG